MRYRTVPLICIAILFLIVGSMYHKAVHKDEYPIENSKMNETNGSLLDGFTGHVCAECGAKCEEGKEMYSSGDAVSYYEPYYLCGDQYCIKSRYRKDLRMHGTAPARSNSSQDYYAGDDGRLYESKPCGLCNGTGIESNAYGDARVCPMCDGKGHESY